MPASPVGRQRRLHPKAALRPRGARRQRPAQGRRPVAHPGDPVALVRARRPPAPAPSSVTTTRTVAGLVPDGHRRRSRPAGVPAHVGQRLLHDPVRRPVHLGGQRPRLAGPRVPSPAARPRRSSSARPVQAGRRRARRLLVAPAAARRATERTSRSASALAGLIAVSASRACSGRLSSRCSPTPACTLISDRWWPRTSCSSRAIRSRSSLCLPALLLGLGPGLLGADLRHLGVLERAHPRGLAEREDRDQPHRGDDRAAQVEPGDLGDAEPFGERPAAEHVGGVPQAGDDRGRHPVTRPHGREQGDGRRQEERAGREAEEHPGERGAERHDHDRDRVPPAQHERDRPEEEQ